MTSGNKLIIGVVVLIAIVVAVIAFKPREIEVAVPASGPAVVEEPVPTDPEEKLVFDRRKAASACRIAILQSLKDPSTAEFTDEIEKTPWVTEDGGDYTFKIIVKARNETAAVTRRLDCRAHQEAAGWSVAKLAEIGSP